jgi:hypothetical protein
VSDTPETFAKELEFVFKNVVEFLKFGEAKNAALIALNGVVLVNALKMLADGTIKAEPLVLYGWVLVAFAAISLLLAMLSFAPQTKIDWMWGRIDSASRRNVIFYGEIRNMSAKEYLEELAKSLGSDRSHFTDYEEDFANQIVVNSKIAYRKYNFFRVALWFLVSALFTPLIGLVLYVCIDPNQNVLRK